MATMSTVLSSPLKKHPLPDRLTSAESSTVAKSLDAYTERSPPSPLEIENTMNTIPVAVALTTPTLDPCTIPLPPSPKSSLSFRRPPPLPHGMPKLATPDSDALFTTYHKSVDDRQVSGRGKRVVSGLSYGSPSGRRTVSGTLQHALKREYENKLQPGMVSATYAEREEQFVDEKSDRLNSEEKSRDLDGGSIYSAIPRDKCVNQSHGEVRTAPEGWVTTLSPRPGDEEDGVRSTSVEKAATWLGVHDEALRVPSSSSQDIKDSDRPIKGTSLPQKSLDLDLDPTPGLDATQTTDLRHSAGSLDDDSEKPHMALAAQLHHDQEDEEKWMAYVREQLNVLFPEFFAEAISAADDLQGKDEEPTAVDHLDDLISTVSSTDLLVDQQLDREIVTPEPNDRRHLSVLATPGALSTSASPRYRTVLIPSRRDADAAVPNGNDLGADLGLPGIVNGNVNVREEILGLKDEIGRLRDVLGSLAGEMRGRGEMVGGVVPQSAVPEVQEVNWASAEDNQRAPVLRGHGGGEESDLVEGGGQQEEDMTSDCDQADTSFVDRIIDEPASLLQSKEHRGYGSLGRPIPESFIENFELIKDIVRLLYATKTHNGLPQPLGVGAVGGEVNEALIKAGVGKLDEGEEDDALFEKTRLKALHKWLLTMPASLTRRE